MHTNYRSQSKGESLCYSFCNVAQVAWGRWVSINHSYRPITCNNSRRSRLGAIATGKPAPCVGHRARSDQVAKTSALAARRVINLYHSNLPIRNAHSKSPDIMVILSPPLPLLFSFKKPQSKEIANVKKVE